jgi:hypothetical protein
MNSDKLDNMNKSLFQALSPSPLLTPRNLILEKLSIYPWICRYTDFIIDLDDNMIYRTDKAIEKWPIVNLRLTNPTEGGNPTKGGNATITPNFMNELYRLLHNIYWTIYVDISFYRPDEFTTFEYYLVLLILVFRYGEKGHHYRLNENKLKSRIPSLDWKYKIPMLFELLEPVVCAYMIHNDYSLGIYN